MSNLEREIPGYMESLVKAYPKGTLIGIGVLMFASFMVGALVF